MGTVISSAAGVLFISVITQVLGYIRESLFAYYYGTASELAAYQVAEVIPFVFTQIVVNGIPLALTPLFVRNCTSRMLNVTVQAFGVVMAICMLVTMIYSTNIVDSITPGFNTIEKELCSILTFMLAPNILFISIAAIFNSFLGANLYFIVPTMVYSLLNIVVVCALLLFENDIISIAYSSALASVIVCLILGYICKKKYEFSLMLCRISKSELLELMRVFLPVCAVAVLAAFNVLLDKYYSSMAGGVIIYSYAYKIAYIPVFLISMSLNRVMLPRFTRYAIDGDEKKVYAVFTRMLLFVTASTGVVCCIVYIFGETIIGAVFGHGQFLMQDVMLTAECLRILAIGILGMVITNFCQSIAYAHNDYMLAFKVMILHYGVYFVVCNVAMENLEVSTIALANVLGYSVMAAFWVYTVLKKYCRL